MICRQRRKMFFVKFVLSVAAAWLIIVMLLSVPKRFFGKRDKDVPSLIYSNTNKDLKNPILPVEILDIGKKEQIDEEYAPVALDVPHWRAMFQDMNLLVRLPNYGEPGEYGVPVLIGNLTMEEEAIKAAGWQRNAFNEFASDKISVHRHLPDVRPEGCRKEKYSRNLPKTSVIVCFHNEARSVLYRTIHSIIERTPPNLLEEIILVDDYSNLTYIHDELESYVAPLGKVKILRATKREGLIRARLLGAAIAKAPVLTFLDSHCECAPGWIEPLLQKIQDNSRAVVAPIIDIIDEDTFQFNFRESGEFGVGGFNWDLQFDWHNMPERDILQRKNSWDPVRTPTIAGGLFTISKEFFDYIGRYDDGFDIWGAENLELSFKTWMCGGTLEAVPCSHVGHVFRKRSPYQWRPGENVFRRNCIRLAEVWLDDYKHVYYKRLGTDAYNVVEQKQYGDVSSRVELRKRLNCKSFDWYLKNVFPEQYVPHDLVAEGEIRNLGLGGNTCLDSEAKGESFFKPVGMWACHLQGGNQYFYYTQIGEIRRDFACLDYAGDSEVLVMACHGQMGNQMWYYDQDKHYIMHYTTGQCLTMTPDKQRVTMEYCSDNPMQMWGMQSFDGTKLLLENYAT